MKFRFKPAELGFFNTANSDTIFLNFKKRWRQIGLTRGNFSLIDLIHSALKKTGSAHVIVTTWSAGIKDVHQVKWMQNNDLIKTFCLITDHSYVTRKNKYMISIEELFGVENIRTSEIHAKFVLIHNENYKVCIRSSMNLNANKTCESFEIDESPQIFDFYMQFVEHTFGDMPKGFTESSAVVNGSIDRFFSKHQTENIYSGWAEI